MSSGGISLLKILSRRIYRTIFMLNYLTKCRCIVALYVCPRKNSEKRIYFKGRIVVKGLFCPSLLKIMWQNFTLPPFKRKPLREQEYQVISFKIFWFQRVLSIIFHVPKKYPERMLLRQRLQFFYNHQPILMTCLALHVYLWYPRVCQPKHVHKGFEG